AFENVIDTEGLADGAEILVLAFEGERGGTTNHLEAGQSRELRRQLLGETVGEIVLILGAAQIRKREDGDRGTLRYCGRGSDRRVGGAREGMARDDIRGDEERRDEAGHGETQSLLRPPPLRSGGDGDSDSTVRGERSERGSRRGRRFWIGPRGR